MKSFIQLFKDYSLALPEKAQFGAVIIETRKVKDFGAIVRNHLYFLPETWGLKVYHGVDNEQFVRDELSMIDGVEFVNLGFDKTTASHYNHLLTTAEFWKTLDFEKVLIFQTDSLLLRCCIDGFLQYDYVGAPWSHINIEGGNGGLSLRTVDMMEKICVNHKYNSISDGNEDIFFSKYLLEEGGKTPPKHIAQRFSVETIFYDKPVGIHAAWKYLKPNEFRHIIDNALTDMAK